MATKKKLQPDEIIKIYYGIHHTTHEVRAVTETREGWLSVKTDSEPELAAQER